MILLDDIVQILARPDFHPGGQHSALFQRGDSSMRRGIAVKRDPLSYTVPLYRTGEELPGRRYLSLCSLSQKSTASPCLSAAR
jgi:hypothetical protein